MKKIKEYMVISESTLKGLEREANDYITYGWQPVGNHIQTNTIPYQYQQTMVKYED